MGKNVAPHLPPQQREVAKRLHSLSCGRHSLSTLFRDWVVLSSLAFENSVRESDAAWEAREAEYLDIARRYEKPVLDGMAEATGMLCSVAKELGARDLVGEIYMALELSNGHAGQFFTPYAISSMMARMTFDKAVIEGAIAAKGHVSVQDPCCGGGSMLIAAAESFRELGFDPETELIAYGVDIDPCCARMAHLSCSIYGLSARIENGNSLSNTGYRDQFDTPGLKKLRIAHRVLRTLGPSSDRATELRSAIQHEHVNDKPPAMASEAEPFTLTSQDPAPSRKRSPSARGRPAADVPGDLLSDLPLFAPRAPTAARAA